MAHPIVGAIAIVVVYLVGIFFTGGFLDKKFSPYSGHEDLLVGFGSIFWPIYWVVRVLVFFFACIVRLGASFSK